MTVTSAEALVPSQTEELPVLRLRAVPPCEPPYDDELPTGAATTGAFVLDGPVGPLRTLAPAPLRLVPGFDEDADAASSRTPTTLLPPARPVAHALVQGLLEVLAGVRPVSQLQRTTTPELFAELEALVHGRPRTTGTRPSTGAVRSLHVQERPEGVAEVCATVQRGRRAAAIALRLEGIGERWCCTDVEGL
jgi:hypothetical protein